MATPPLKHIRWALIRYSTILSYVWKRWSTLLRISFLRLPNYSSAHSHRNCVFTTLYYASRQSMGWVEPRCFPSLGIPAWTSMQAWDCCVDWRYSTDVSSRHTGFLWEDIRANGLLIFTDPQLGIEEVLWTRRAASIYYMKYTVATLVWFREDSVFTYLSTRSCALTSPESARRH